MCFQLVYNILKRRLRRPRLSDCDGRRISCTHDLGAIVVVAILNSFNVVGASSAGFGISVHPIPLLRRWPSTSAQILDHNIIEILLDGKFWLPFRLRRTDIRNARMVGNGTDHFGGRRNVTVWDTWSIGMGLFRFGKKVWEIKRICAGGGGRITRYHSEMWYPNKPRASQCFSTMQILDFMSDDYSSTPSNALGAKMETRLAGSMHCRLFQNAFIHRISSTPLDTDRPSRRKIRLTKGKKKNAQQTVRSKHSEFRTSNSGRFAVQGLEPQLIPPPWMV